MGDTEISWTHRPGTRGRTWNPTQGCRRVSPGCERCYAERLAARFAESGWSKGLINLKTRKWNGVVRLAAHKLLDPIRWREPSTVFTNSMSDLFHEDMPEHVIDRVVAVMMICATREPPRHTFQTLTKRAARMRSYFTDEGTLVRVARAAGSMMEDGDGWFDGIAFRPEGLVHPNLWWGVSVENQAAADERIPELLRTPAAVRFLSCEPLLGKVQLREEWLRGGFIECPDENKGDEVDPCMGCPAIPNDGTRDGDYCGAVRGARVDWIISGCESGPGARACDVAWLRSLRDQCASAGVAYFLKQAVEPTPHDQPAGLLAGIRHLPPRGASLDGSKRKAAGVIELPYLDGVQHSSFPEVAS